MSTRVLVVDDERSLLETLEIVLRRSGHEVLTSDDEAQALELFRDKKPAIDEVVVAVDNAIEGCEH